MNREPPTGLAIANPHRTETVPLGASNLVRNSDCSTHQINTVVFLRIDLWAAFTDERVGPSPNPRIPPFRRAGPV